MPIKIPDSLPAKSILESEHIFVMTEHRALHQDIRPLKILLLNLMPTKNGDRNAVFTLFFKYAVAGRSRLAANEFACF